MFFFFISKKMCAIEEELESKLGVFRFQLNGKYHIREHFYPLVLKAHWSFVNSSSHCEWGSAVLLN